MPLVRHGAARHALIAVKGHPFDRQAFASLFDDRPDMALSFVDQPLVQRLMNPAGLAGIDALVLYDMPGIDFDARPSARSVPPSPDLVAGLTEALDQGIGVVALHHAIAGWPAWEDYGAWLGGLFRYRPGTYRGAPRADGGYRHDVDYEAVVMAPDHPVTRGVPERFGLKDELYLYDVFEDDVIPLLRADHDFTDRAFYSAAAAVDGRMFSNEGWSRPRGSALIGWVKNARNAPLVYLQPGDGPSGYDNPHVRRLVANAIDWVMSAEARDWARARHQSHGRV